MKPPVWLEAFHRDWQRLRGRRAEPGRIPLARDWEDLLDAAGLSGAAERAQAGREAEALEREGRLVLARHRYRQFIERVRLPVAGEAWLQALFQRTPPAECLARSVAVVEAQRAAGHPVLSDEWEEGCARVLAAFKEGRGLRPFRWQEPEAAGKLLELIRALTAREWGPFTLVRDASVALGLDSKALERNRRVVESGLTLFFQRPATLETLGIMASNSCLLFDGPLTLHFADGTRHESGGLRHGDQITAADLKRAVRVTTTAVKLVSVENRKTTFRRLAAANQRRDALVFATSFPTLAVRLLLEKLPESLPCWHFGDTDAAGYLILLKLRQIAGRKVRRLEMDWQDKAGSPALTLYDHCVLANLRSAPELADCRADLDAMLAAGRKGNFEQEARGLPQLADLILPRD